MLAHENVHSHTMYYEGSTLRAIGIAKNVE